MNKVDKYTLLGALAGSSLAGVGGYLFSDRKNKIRNAALAALAGGLTGGLTGRLGYSYYNSPSIGLDDLPYDLPSNVKNRSFWLDNLNEESIKDTVKRNRNLFDAMATTSFEQDGRLFY